MQRQLLGVVTAALVVVVTTPVVATPAHATAYRYWSYWHAPTASWDFSRVGATGYRPADGAAEGWRFAVSPGTASAPAPRQSPATAFDTICASTPPEDGKKRVALVVDFGTKADAPSGDSAPPDALRGSCVVIRSNANGNDVLVAAGYGIRSESGLVCGLAGYPSRGCGDVVADTAVPAAPTARPSTATKQPSSGSGSGSGTAKSGANQATKAAGRKGESTTEPSASPAANSNESSASAPSTSSATAAPTEAAIPSAEPLAASSALPSLVTGAPAADTGGTSSNPLRAGLAVLVIAAIATAAFLRTRARRAS